MQNDEPMEPTEEQVAEDIDATEQAELEADETPEESSDEAVGEEVSDVEPEAEVEEDAEVEESESVLVTAEDLVDVEDAPVESDGREHLVQELEYTEAPKAQGEEGEPPPAFESVAHARAVMEGLLFSSNDPITESRLSKLMNGLHPRTVRGMLLELQMDYDRRGGALQIVEIAGGFQMCTRPHLADWMFRMHKHKKRSALSPATLETLAIIAYKQPVTKGELESIRGVESSGPIRTLQDLNLIESKARKEVPGRPQLYSTTEQFLKTFGLRNLGDMPSISELKQQFLDRPLHKPVVEPSKAVPADEEITTPEVQESDDMQEDENDTVEMGPPEDNDGLYGDADEVIDGDTVDSEADEELDVQGGIPPLESDAGALDNLPGEENVEQVGQDDQTMPPDENGR